MFLRIIALMLLVAFAMQTFQKPLIVMNYYANTTAFAKNCENKNKPVIKCHGKCQMMKKLKAEEKKEAQNPERKGENKGEVLISSPSADFLTLPSFEEFIIDFQVFQMPLFGDQYADIFHPPASI